MDLSTFEYGVHAEKLVCEYYTSLGFIILEQRYKSEYGEIDIIAIKDNLLLFVEVKARRGPAHHREYITQKQLLRLRRAAEFFISSFSRATRELQYAFNLAVVVDDALSEIVEDILS